MNFAKRLDDLVAQMTQLKAEFRTALTDTQHYSLEERWKMFEKAPYELVSGCSSSRIVGEDLLAELLYINGDLCLHSDLNIDRYQVIDMCDIVERVVEENTSDELSYEQGFSKLMLNPTFTSFLEEILQSGVRSFHFDW